MKSNLILFALSLIFITAACNKSEPVICSVDLECVDESCLFAIDYAEGITKYLNCFGQWGIISKHPSEGHDIWLIAVDAPSGFFEQDSVEVKFCGYVKDNSFPLLLPDPMVGPVYEIHLTGLREK